MASNYTAAVLHKHDGRCIDLDLHFTGAYTWKNKLRALQRACKMLGIELEWGDWAYVGGNAWTYCDIVNA